MPNIKFNISQKSESYCVLAASVSHKHENISNITFPAAFTENKTKSNMYEKPQLTLNNSKIYTATADNNTR